MALGELTLRLPRQVGVRMTLDKFLAASIPRDWSAGARSYLSPGYDKATRHLDIDIIDGGRRGTVDWLE